MRALLVTLSIFVAIFTAAKLLRRDFDVLDFGSLIAISVAWMVYCAWVKRRAEVMTPSLMLIAMWVSLTPFMVLTIVLAVSVVSQTGSERKPYLAALIIWLPIVGGFIAIAASITKSSLGRARKSSSITNEEETL